MCPTFQGRVLSVKRDQSKKARMNCFDRNSDSNYYSSFCVEVCFVLSESKIHFNSNGILKIKTDSDGLELHFGFNRTSGRPAATHPPRVQSCLEDLPLPATKTTNGWNLTPRSRYQGGNCLVLVGRWSSWAGPDRPELPEMLPASFWAKSSILGRRSKVEKGIKLVFHFSIVEHSHLVVPQLGGHTRTL